MYRYVAKGNGFKFNYVERSGGLLHVGSVIRPPQSSDEFRVTRVVKGPLSIFGFFSPMRITSGIVEVERYHRSG